VRARAAAIRVLRNDMRAPQAGSGRGEPSSLRDRAM
jgi:hypothetical protein